MTETPIEHRVMHTAEDLLRFLLTFSPTELAGPVRLSPVNSRDEMTEGSIVAVELSDGSSVRDLVLGSRECFANSPADGAPLLRRDKR